MFSGFRSFSVSQPTILPVVFLLLPPYNEASCSNEPWERICMAEFTWSAKYSIGNAQIDAEHQRLIELANDVATFASSEEKLARIKEAIVALYDYVKIHFQHEEEYMLQLGYPQYAEHQKLHEGIIAEMNGIMKHSGNLDALVYKFKRLMHTWVLEHILTEDSRIAPAKKSEDPADSSITAAVVGSTALKTE